MSEGEIDRKREREKGMEDKILVNVTKNHDHHNHCMKYLNQKTHKSVSFLKEYDIF